MRALLVRVVLLTVLLGVYSALRPAEIEGQWGICQTCDSIGGWAQCFPTSRNEGWNYCEAVTQDANDPRRSFCILGWYCPWLAV